MPANDMGRERIPQWPDVPKDVRKMVERFYELVDTHSDDAHEEWTQLFTDEGMMEIGSKIRKGAQELQEERKASWELIESRKHTTYRVYTTDSSGLDIVVIGKVDIVTRSGVWFSQEYAQNFILEETRGDYRVRKFQTWLDSAVLKKALSGEQP